VERHDNESTQRNPARAVSDEIREVLQGKAFATLEEANVFIAAYMQQKNQRPMANFQGLSLDQMHRFISFPFDSPHLVTFTNAPEESLTAPIMRLFGMLVEAIGEQGLKPPCGRCIRCKRWITSRCFWG